MPGPEAIPVQQSTNQTNEPHSNLLVLLLGVAALVVLGVLVFFYYHKNRAIKIIVPVQSQPQASVPTYAQDRSVVDAHSTLSIPAIASSVSVDQSLLPAHIADFILSGAAAVMVRQTAFVDGGSGYVATYTATGNVLDLYTQLSTIDKSSTPGQQPLYSTVSGTGTTLAAQIEEQGAAYSLVIDLDALSQSTTKVTVTAVTRK